MTIDEMREIIRAVLEYELAQYTIADTEEYQAIGNAERYKLLDAIAHEIAGKLEMGMM